MAFDTFNLAQIYGAADRANAQRDAQQYQQYQIQRQMRDDQRQDAVRGAYKIGPDGQLDRQGTYAGLYQVDHIAALDLQGKLSAQDAAAAKAGQESTKRELEIASERAKIGRDLIASATPETWPAIVAQGQKMGMGWANNAPAQYNQDWVRSNVTTADKYIELNTPDIKEVDLGGTKQFIDTNPITNPSIKGTKFDKTLTPDAVLTDQRTRSENALNRGVTIRGQNMTDARAREANSTVKPPSGYRLKADGTLEAIPGGPADKKTDPKLSEGERKAATLLKRLEFSQEQLNNAVTKDSAKPSLTANGLRMVGADALANTITSGNRQRVEAAQLDILDAALTLGTGAAYTKEQLEGYRKSYFPQIGDDPNTIADKTARLNNVIEAAKVAAGNAAPQVDKQNIIPKNEMMPNNTLSVAAPNGKTYTFKSQVEANEFKRQAGIK